MRADVIPDIMTADELLALRMPGKSTELVRGHLVVREPPSAYHGQIAARLAYLVGAFVYPNDAGVLFGQDSGFRITSDPDTVRAPDLAFLRRERKSEVPPAGYGEFAPDLVVEIVSPGDRPGELLAKISDWLSAEVRLVWVIDPQRHQAHVHRADGTIAILDRDGALDGEDVLPRFRCTLREVLE